MSTRKYEIMVLLDPSVEERSVTPSLENYLKVITDAEGTVDNFEFWGKRRLAYEINKKTEAFYAVAEFQASSDAARELDRQLNLNESVIRTKLLRTDVK